MASAGRDAFSAGLVLSKPEAVKGFEFDTVIVADVSADMTPRPGALPEDYWRDAAVLYAALTRARDELIVTHCDRPSALIEPLRPFVDWHEGAGRDELERHLKAVLRR